ncbi:MAG: B12-binding domain-containing radical SAM protein [Planctomycetota bacterium]|jgi:radical SAM superfamily enzyme YgiQ (UPF0313 family)
MELPFRPPGDELLKPGELGETRRRLRATAQHHDLTTVIVCAFDHRTRMLPFIYADVRMAPAGVRAVGSELVDAGFEKTRVVLQQWNRRVRPTRMQLDGRTPDLLLISSMQLHWAPCRELIRDACRIDPAHRPLVIVGGPKAIYEPWDVFSSAAPIADPADPWAADLAVTGEAYILLELLEVLLGERAGGERLRQTFLRSRDAGLLDHVPGLIYARSQTDGVAEELIDTGIQRLPGDLDELAHPALGYSLLEPPGRSAALGPTALPADRVRRFTPLSSLQLTQGCKFHCQYCPIPAYNQQQYRTKSGRRIADELIRLNRQYGLHNFFGTDDNFFNDHARTLSIAETLANTQVDGQPLRRRARLGTEVTVHDTLQLAEHLPLIRKAGIRALWIGVEDMSGALVRKGQGADKTTEAFRLLRQHGIFPMPMMMHHDDQPLITPGKAEGLLSQIRLLKKAGACSLQVLMITPSSGSKMYESAYTSGMVYAAVGKRRVDPYMADGNYVIASQHPHPWRKQFNIMLAYLSFYNPLRLLWHACRVKNRLWLQDVGMQAFGIWGLCKTVRRTLGWAFRLMCCKIERHRGPPISRIPMRDPAGESASHSLLVAPEADE